MAKQFIATTLMDGYADGPHVTEAQTGIANQGLYGPDDYVLDEGKKAEAQILTNNSVRVFDATFVIQGRRDVMAANAYADVTIANGEQGMYRNDIIVRKYEKDEMTEIENTSFDVIKGTPSSGVATDPEIPTGDIRTGATMHNMALYRVKLEGLNIVALEPMFKVLYNMADIKKELESLNGKMEDFEVDTMEELTKSYGLTVLFKQIGAIKIIRIAGNSNGQLTTHNISLPEKARARYYYSTPTRVGSKWGEVQINGTSCSIKMDTPIDASSYVNIWSVYI